MFAAVKDQPFRDFLFALRESGCRPGEVRKVTAANVDLDLGIWVIEHHKTRKKTGVPRIVYLTPGMVELCRRLVERWPQGRSSAARAVASRSPETACAAASAGTGGSCPTSRV